MEHAPLRCGSCGGAVPENAPSCPFCSVSVATRRCASCYHRNLPSAVHCSGCGRELRDRVAQAAGTHACPACESTTLARIGEGARAVDECPRCGGQFVAHDVLQRLCEERLQLGTKQAPQVPGRLGPVRYLPCPTCQKRMNRKNFGERSGVVVDVCKDHGVWLDTGELPRVLAFVERGGLGEAARRQQDAAREAKRKALGAAFPVHHDAAVITDSLEADILVAALRALLS